MIIGIGADVVSVSRFAETLRRTPSMLDRLFTEHERTGEQGHPRPPSSLAARFAAKEAVAKALGAPYGLRWHDCEVVAADDGRPWLELQGTVLAAAQEQGIDRWHLSLSHDGDLAVAYVVAERA
ncbi:MAG: holo-ACP synthase [Frankiales bacterium]|nr:holo-ACP synthase [Frankiales bacterium]